jgi:hypothetical protein
MGLREPGWLQTGTGVDRPYDLNTQFGLFCALGGVWLVAYVVLSLGWLGAWWILHALHFVVDAAILPVFWFVAAFCITGSVDALWRLVLVWIALRRYRRAGHKACEKARPLLRIADASDGTVVIQLAAGFFFAFQAWSKIP